MSNTIFYFIFLFSFSVVLIQWLFILLWVKMPYNPEFEKDKHQKGGGHHNLFWNIIKVSSPNQFVWDWKKRKEKVFLYHASKWSFSKEIIGKILASFRENLCLLHAWTCSWKRWKSNTTLMSSFFFVPSFVSTILATLFLPRSLISF